MSKKTSASKDWNSIYIKKTDPKDMPEERGALYEILNLYGVSKYLDKAQRRGIFRYVPVWCARTVKLYIAGGNVFETDNVISMRRKNRFMRALQKYFNIRDEFTFNVQLKNYDEIVKVKTVKESVSQTGLANILANNLWLNAVTESWGKVEFFETENKDLGANYITYNLPAFKEFDGDLEKKLTEIKKAYEKGEKLSENIEEDTYETSISQVIEVSLDIEGVKTSALKVKGKSGEPVIFYISRGSQSCIVAEENYRQDLGKMIFTKQNKHLIHDKYFLVNSIEKKHYEDIIWTLETALNPEIIGFVSPFGIQTDRSIKNTGVNSISSMADFAKMFKEGKVFSLMKKFNYDPKSIMGEYFRVYVKLRLYNLLSELVIDKNVPDKALNNVVNRFVDRKGILL
jgi:hypothetical protein